MSLRTLRPGQYAWAPHEPPFSLALELAKETQGAACMKGRGTAIDIGARSGTETAEILNEGLYAVAIECQPDEYVRLYAKWRLELNVSLFNLCAGNVGPKVSIIYNADGASTMVHDNAVGHSGERHRYLHSDRKGTPVIMMPLDQLIWGTPLPPTVGGSPATAPLAKAVQALVPPKLLHLPHPICAIKVDIQGFVS